MFSEMDNKGNTIMRENLFQEKDLAALAKKCREESGYSMAEIARFLQVSRSVIFNAENVPEKSLIKTRIRIIELTGKKKVAGPLYFVRNF
jgi:predicted transcriptional regulator